MVNMSFDRNNGNLSQVLFVSIGCCLSRRSDVYVGTCLRSCVCFVSGCCSCLVVSVGSLSVIYTHAWYAERESVQESIEAHYRLLRIKLMGVNLQKGRRGFEYHRQRLFTGDKYEVLKYDGDWQQLGKVGGRRPFTLYHQGSRTMEDTGANGLGFMRRQQL